jgi:cell division protein FtsI (penicillin-binding protein 3)
MSQPGALHVRRRRVLLAGLLTGGVLLLGRGFQVQVVQGATWESRADRQHQERLELPAPRGTLYDRNGIPLATTRERIRVAVAPHEVQDAVVTGRRLAEVLELDAPGVRRALDRNRRWVVIPGGYDPAVRSALDGLRGVYLERELERFHPHGAVALAVLGRVSADGRALSGLELELDSVLRGEAGYAVVRRDSRGAPIPGALFRVAQPRAGRDVHLTLDLGLQEIAEQALRRTVSEERAGGGDLIFADPRTGEILAAASHQQGGALHWRGVTDPYEPGSTIKPFILAALLDRGLATLADSLFGEDGRLHLGRRTISDVTPHGWLTAAEVVRYSSNVGMVKLADRLAPGEQYAALRDFGFGTPTGVAYPSESGGRLSRPDAWSAYSQSSLAMGYELSVTPLQMTMAYGALANGGRLLEPRLVREIRTPEGRLVRRWEPREVRRSLSASTAALVADVLREAVQEGTGRRAGLGEFMVAGKTGTARVFENGRYRTDAYTASFAGFFPARDPQLVFLVKLDRGSEYGGAMAAPVTRATLAAALAARASPLDRRAVAVAFPAPGAPALALDAGRPAAWLPPAPGPFVFRLAAGAPRSAPPRSAPDPVPEVRGASGRDAAATLHAAGFRVSVEGVGQVRKMEPAAGSVAERGTMVRLMLGRSQ